jgi:hypothetical protein
MTGLLFILDKYVHASAMGTLPPQIKQGKQAYPGSQGDSRDGASEKAAHEEEETKKPRLFWKGEEGWLRQGESVR